MACVSAGGIKGAEGYLGRGEENTGRLGLGELAELALDLACREAQLLRHCSSEEG